MSSVIKLKAKPRALKTVMKNQEQFSNPVDHVAEQRLQMKKEIERQYKVGYDEGYEEGFQRGKDAGYTEALHQLEEKYIGEVNKKTEEYYNILSSFEEKLLEYEGSFDEIIIKLAGKIAEKIVQREISERSTVESIIRASLKKIMGANEVAIKINPQDYELLDKENKLKVFDQAFTRVKFEINEQISVGGCFIETDIGNVDARISTQLEEMQKQLDATLE